MIDEIVDNAQMHVVLVDEANSDNAIRIIGDASILINNDPMANTLQYMEFEHTLGTGEWADFSKPGNTRFFFDFQHLHGLMLHADTNYLNHLWMFTNTTSKVSAENDNSTLTIDWNTHVVIHMPYNQDEYVTRFIGEVRLIGTDANGETIGFEIQPK